MVELNADLKPCPFCGSDGMLLIAKFGREPEPRFSVRCKKCKCDFGWEFFSKEEAEEAWNRRANEKT